jgi:hypothetical protein
VTDSSARAARDQGVRRISTLTAALALAAVAGTGVVVKEAQALTASRTATTAPSSSTSSSQRGGTSGAAVQPPASAPAAPQAPPIVVSSGS